MRLHIALILVIAISSLHVNSNIAPQEAEVEILADVIAKSISTLTSIKDSWYYLPENLLFGTVNISKFDDIIDRVVNTTNYLDIVKLKRLSEILRYNSSALDSSVANALNNSNLNAYHLPLSESDGAYNIWEFMALHGYKYAKDLNMTHIWNATLAEQGLKRCYDVHYRSFWKCDAEVPKPTSLFGTRWMNTANLAKAFLLVHEASNSSDSLNMSIQQWKDFNSRYWVNSSGYYFYAPSWKTLEWSTIEVVYNYYPLLVANGTLDNFERIFLDLQTRYLEGGWNAPLWYSGLIQHFKGSSQKRVRGTFDAWHMLHNFYANFTQQNQAQMRQMLTGDGNTSLAAWQHVLTPTGSVFGETSYRFKIDSDKPFSDAGTITGASLLFLLGIVPESGSGLGLARNSEGYSGGILQDPTLRFLYSQNLVTLPIKANTTLRFMYGTEHPTAHFDNEGVYKIQFTEDWNSIVNTSEISYEEILSLPAEPEYDFGLRSDPRTNTPPEPTVSSSTSSTTSSSVETTSNSSVSSILTSPNTTSTPVSTSTATSSRSTVETTETPTSSSTSDEALSNQITPFLLSITILIRYRRNLDQR